MLDLTDPARNAMLNMLSTMMDGGSLELLGADEHVLAVLGLSNPAATPAAGGELIFNKIIDEGAALGTGIATRARILGPDGREVFACDVGNEKSDAVIRLNTTRIFRGGPVQMRSFRLVMP
jgi:hypothetical protein